MEARTSDISDAAKWSHRDHKLVIFVLRKQTMMATRLSGLLRNRIVLNLVQNQFNINIFIIDIVYQFLNNSHEKIQ
jgi:hypothetical protein